MITTVPPRTPEDWDTPPPHLFKCNGRWYVDPSPAYADLDVEDIFEFYDSSMMDTQLLLLTNKHPALGREPGDIRGMYLWSLRPSDRPISDDRYYFNFGEGSFGVRG